MPQTTAPAVENLPEVTIVPASCFYPQTTPCVCGKGAYFWDDADGWHPRGRVIDDNRVDVDCDGVTEECPHCERLIVAEDPAQRR